MIWQGKGAGSVMQAAVDLADRWLNLTWLELEVYTDNEAAVRLYRKFGFVLEGTLSRYAYRDGQFVDAVTSLACDPEEDPINSAIPAGPWRLYG